MKTEIFGYDEGEKPAPQCLDQGFVMQWDNKGKRQLWLWGFKKGMDAIKLKEIVKAVLEDFLQS